MNAKCCSGLVKSVHTRYSLYIASLYNAKDKNAGTNGRSQRRRAHFLYNNLLPNCKSTSHTHKASVYLCPHVKKVCSAGSLVPSLTSVRPTPGPLTPCLCIIRTKLRLPAAALLKPKSRSFSSSSCSKFANCLSMLAATSVVETRISTRSQSDPEGKLT